MTNMKAPSKRDPKSIAAAVLVALIVLAGIILIGVNTFGGGDRARKTTSPPGTTPSQGAPSSSSSCGLPDGNQVVPTEPPKAVWKIVGTSAAPVSPTIGPGKSQAGVGTCFAHSPSGALFAATWLTILLNEPKYATADLARSRILPGAALDSFLKAPDKPTEHVPFQIAGFRIEDFSPARSTVSVVIRYTEGAVNGQLAQVVMTMVWSDGDWKWQLPAAGYQGNGITSLNGFTSWNGVS